MSFCRGLDLTNKMKDILKSLHEKECLIPDACWWYIVKEISKHDGNSGFKLEEMMNYLKERLLEFNKEKKDFAFHFGMKWFNIAEGGESYSLRDVLEDFVDAGVLWFDNSRGYTVTERGKIMLEKKISLIKKYFPLLKEEDYSI